MRVPDVVDLVTSDAPPLRHTVDEIVDSGRRVERRRRAAWATSGVAALAALAVAGAAVLPSLAARPGNNVANKNLPGAAAAPATAKFTVPADPFTFTFKAFDAGKLHVQDPIVASTAYQIASVYEDGRTTNDRPASAEDVAKRGSSEPTLYAYLILYRPGAFNPNAVKDAKWTTVAGHKALEKDGPGATLDMTHRLLAWQYSDNAWAVLETHSNGADDPSAQDLQGVVSALVPSKPAPARLPFTMSYVPAGYHPVELGSHAMAGLNGIAVAREGDFGGAIFAKPAPSTQGLTEPYGGVQGNDIPGSFQIFIVPNANSNQRLADGSKPPTEPRCGNGFCNAWSSDGAVNIQVASGGRLSNSEMTKILKGIKLADVKNVATWTDAATALLVKP
ncbi:MAG TPA: hypothetical protein VGP57_06780 [Actinoplanes sp.]|jgi:hypothetical protein|nr:hypothetical protein [Actinoplanes sp.]